MNKGNKESPLTVSKDWLKYHKRCPNCNKWMIEWAKNQEDKVTFPNKNKLLMWRCNCGHKEEHPWTPLSEEGAFKKAWKKAQEYARGE